MAAIHESWRGHPIPRIVPFKASPVKALIVVGSGRSYRVLAAVESLHVAHVVLDKATSERRIPIKEIVAHLERMITIWR